MAAHRGHDGNELADHLAKSGALCLPSITDTLPPPMSRTKTLVKESLMTVWEREWQACPKGRTTKGFFPTTRRPNHLATLSISRELAQVLTGHSYLRSHLFRLRLSDSPTCCCGVADETVSHVFFWCSLLDPCRTELKALLHTCSWPPDISALCASRVTICALNRFIVSCGRFVNPFLAIHPLPDHHHSANHRARSGRRGNPT